MNKRQPTSTRTTIAMRRAIQGSAESVRNLARRYGINPKTVAKWRQRNSVADLKTGPKELRSTVLTAAEEACIAVFRQHMVVPLDDCLSTLQTAIPHLTRSSLHRCLQRHNISRQPAPLPESHAPGDHADKALGQFSIVVTELRTAHGVWHLLSAMEISSRFAYACMYEGALSKTSCDFLADLLVSVPCPVRALLTHNDALLQDGAFLNSCRAHHLELRLDQQRARWRDDQLQHIAQTVNKAMAADSPMSHAGEFGRTINRLMTHLNHHCKLRALNGLTPLECIEAIKQDPGSIRIRRTTQSRDSGAVMRRNPAATSGNRKKARRRDPHNTREAILEAARSCLAHDGPEGLSMAEVARIAGVNRGTAYQHFKTREKLIAASAEWVSDKLFRAVFGDPAQVANQQIGAVDVAVLIDRLSSFAMDNPELSRAWLLQVLSSPNPSRDPFWKQYAGSTERFAGTELAEANIDAEVLSVIMLAGAFLWPVWARANAGSKANLRPLAHRFARECLRISMYGNLRSEHYPAIAERLRTYRQHHDRSRNESAQGVHAQTSSEL